MTINTINSASHISFTNLIEQVNSSKVISTSDEPHFLSEFKTALDAISQTQLQAHNKAEAFELGDPNTSLNEVMVEMQKSSVSLQFGIQVRNKLIASYQEIMNMNV